MVTADAVGKIATVNCAGDDVFIPAKGMSKVGQLKDGYRPNVETHVLFGVQYGQNRLVQNSRNSIFNLRKPTRRTADPRGTNVWVYQ